LYWTNFNLPLDLGERKSVNMESKNEVEQWCVFHKYNFRNYQGQQRINKIARNLVDYEAGKTIFEVAMGIIQQPKTNQKCLFANEL
jgi:DNA (cytosine-5)-methyltransferase 1